LDVAPRIVASLSGGKDSVAMLLALIERHGASIIAHYQALPEDWPETLPYVQAVCGKLGVRLVVQQMIYEPVGDGTKVRRKQVRDIHTEGDIVPWGTDGAIAGVTDLAFRRQWPPSAGVRFCTSYFKVSLLNAWVRENRLELGADVHVALGERAAESPRRAKKLPLSERFTSYGLIVSNWLPVHQWPRRDIFRKMRDWGIEPHPAYKAQGMADWQMYDEDAESGPRTSCLFCVYAGYEQCCHQAQAETNQGLLRRMVAFEQATGRTWWARRSATELLASLSN
jgi:3'-phosphoadenosine 5'-phosphosulfate sulfotransferase (PAPS reductase)/FAD synthetase